MFEQFEIRLNTAIGLKTFGLALFMASLAGCSTPSPVHSEPPLMDSTVESSTPPELEETPAPEETRPAESIVLVIDGDPGASFTGTIFADDEQLQVQGVFPSEYAIEASLIICELENAFDTRRVRFKVIRDGRVRYLEGASMDGTARFVYRGNWEMEFYGRK